MGNNTKPETENKNVDEQKNVSQSDSDAAVTSAATTPNPQPTIAMKAGAIEHGRAIMAGQDLPSGTTVTAGPKLDTAAADAQALADEQDDSRKVYVMVTRGPFENYNAGETIGVSREKAMALWKAGAAYFKNETPKWAVVAQVIPAGISMQAQVSEGAVPYDPTGTNAKDAFLAALKGK